MNVAEMGMNPAMMAGALNALPVGAATAALETLAANPEAMSQNGSNYDRSYGSYNECKRHG